MKVAAVDQGTTGTKSFTLADDGTFVSAAAFEHRQIYNKHNTRCFFTGLTEQISYPRSTHAYEHFNKIRPRN